MRGLTRREGGRATDNSLRQTRLQVQFVVFIERAERLAYAPETNLSSCSVAAAITHLDFSDDTKTVANPFPPLVVCPAHGLSIRNRSYSYGLADTIVRPQQRTRSIVPSGATARPEHLPGLNSYALSERSGIR